MPRPKPPEGSWDNHHRRITFYCPAEMVDAIEREMAATGRSKTQVIIDRLRASGLRGDAERERPAGRLSGPQRAPTEPQPGRGEPPGTPDAL